MKHSLNTSRHAAGADLARPTSAHRHLVTFFAIVLLSVLALGLVPSAVQAQSQGPFVDIDPSHPTTDDFVGFTLSGTWHNGCTPKFHNGGVHRFTVELFYVTSHGSCSRAFTPYKERVATKGPLEAGTYDLRVYIDKKQIHRRSFDVTQAHHQQAVVAFRSGEVTVHEDDHTATFWVERTGSSEGTVRVDYSTEDGTAKPGADYEHKQGTLTWQHGDASAKMISVRLLDDFELEGTEDFTVSLSHPTGAELGHPSRVVVQILDDEKKAPQGGCHADFRTLCLQDGRFEITAEWRTPQGKAGEGNPGAFTDETGYFWFFSNQNIEVLVKILDGCGINDSYWVYVAGLTNIWVELEIRDTKTGELKTWTNPMGQSFRPIEDTGYFDCASK